VEFVDELESRDGGTPRGSAPHDPSIWTFMLAAILIVGVGVGVIALVAVLFSLR
jgi:hypothetical protein